MADITSFLAAEFTEIGLAAAADPHFAERLIEALRLLPTDRDTETDAMAMRPEVQCA
jgi:hypothetical protein